MSFVVEAGNFETVNSNYISNHLFLYSSYLNRNQYVIASLYGLNHRILRYLGSGREELVIVGRVKGLEIGGPSRLPGELQRALK